MDTVIKNINLHGISTERTVSDIEDWINDTANKLNLMLNGPVQDKTEEEVEKKSPYDYCIETGETSEGLCAGSIKSASKCYYRKWKSGILEIWGRRKSNNIVFRSSVWGGFESVVETPAETITKIGVWGTWPVKFVDIPSISFQVIQAESLNYSGDYQIIYSSTTPGGGSLIDTRVQSPYFKIWRGLNTESGIIYNPDITFHAIGHWE